MFRVYRRRQGGKSRWRFDTRCPNWPELECDFVQCLHLSPNEPLCGECERLEAELFRKINESANSLH